MKITSPRLDKQLVNKRQLDLGSLGKLLTSGINTGLVLSIIALLLNSTAIKAFSQTANPTSSDQIY